MDGGSDHVSIVRGWDWDCRIAEKLGNINVSFTAHRLKVLVFIRFHPIVTTLTTRIKGTENKRNRVVRVRLTFIAEAKHSARKSRTVNSLFVETMVVFLFRLPQSSGTK